MQKTGIILINIGSPESPDVKSVRKYLRQFLSDARVLTMPYLLRQFLVNAIIVPFRGPKSAKMYAKLWTKNGSPLIIYANKVALKLQNRLDKNFHVQAAMRYGNPHISTALENCMQNACDKIVIIPLFPQYASSTTGSIVEFGVKWFSKQKTHPSISIVSNFYNNPLFIKAFTNRINEYKLADYDHVLFSFHGLPLSQVYASHKNESCELHNCRSEINSSNHLCYHATCYATARLLAEECKIDSDKYTVCFQSRFAKNWLSPFTDEVIKELADSGVKKLLVVSPAFVADCLETIIEIGDEYNELFLKHGGEKLQLVESLNDSDLWIDCLEDLVKSA